MPLADEINYTVRLPAPAAARKHVLIFFIPGNPGLVEYYRNFLDIVRRRLDAQTSSQDTQYHLHGASLAGFDVGSGPRKIPVAAQGLPLSLDAQVEDVYSRLETTTARLRAENDIKGDLSVVVVGHSIGAYMVLQTIAKWQRQAQQGPTNMTLAAGVCLFPTIYELALSPTGRQVGVSAVPFPRQTKLTDPTTIVAFDQITSICSHRAYDRKDDVLPCSDCHPLKACPAHHPNACRWCQCHRAVPAKQIRRLASSAHG